jgi:hypothetical protein
VLFVSGAQAALLLKGGNVVRRARAAIKAKATTFLERLMGRQRLPAHISLSPEDRLAIAFADELRKLTLDGSYRGVWCKIENELPVPKGFARSAPLIMLKRSAKGVIKGAPDFIFSWAGGSGWIELKVEGGQRRMALVDGELRNRDTARGRLSDEQRDFAMWCAHSGVPARTAHSVNEGLAILREWGRLP